MYTCVYAYKLSWVPIKPVPTHPSRPAQCVGTLDRDCMCGKYNRIVYYSIE